MRFGTKSVVVKEGKVLLIKRSDYSGYNACKWDLPGGRIEKNEGAFEGHKREVFEETRLRIEIIEPIRSWAVDRPEGRHVGVTFLSKFLDGEVVLSNEHTEFRWMSPEEIEATDADEWIKEEVNIAVKLSPGLFKPF